MAGDFAYMRMLVRRRAAKGSSGSAPFWRLAVLRSGLALLAAAVVVRLVIIGIVDHDFYKALASGQHELYTDLFPRRGQIFLRERADSSKEYPAATNRDVWLVYADPRQVTDPQSEAEALAPLLNILPEVLVQKLSIEDDPYEPLAHGVSDEIVGVIRAKDLSGIAFAPETVRVYPEKGIGGHILGFVGSDESGARRGRYGLEGAFDRELAGSPGYLAAERDPAGRWIPVAGRRFVPATDGSDLVLTIDRTVQYIVCEKLKASVSRHGADAGTAIVMDPQTGAVMAMCSSPDFDPNVYNQVTDVSVFNNPAVFGQYEPGSVMKPITIAAAIDQGAVTPATTYEDTGSVEIAGFTIKNSDEEAHGTQTMTEVLEKSLNTGAIFAAQAVGKDVFRSYLERFGLGIKTGIEFSPESPGDISSLKRRGEIYVATASFGQGVTATPMQMLAAFAALANDGKLMRPYIVAEIRRSDGGLEKTEPRLVRQAVGERTATLLGGMLTNVVENGHGKRAGVAGYYVAGKTGTAQVSNPNGPGYLEGVTIGTFIGFAPVADPAFAMIVRIDHPRDVRFAESTAAPLFGEISAFLLQYLQIPPERPIDGRS